MEKGAKEGAGFRKLNAAFFKSQWRENSVSAHQSTSPQPAGQADRQPTSIEEARILPDEWLKGDY